jgi:hypothetical protein
MAQKRRKTYRPHPPSNGWMLRDSGVKIWTRLVEFYGLIVLYPIGWGLRTIGVAGFKNQTLNLA